jgi:phosphoribosylamine--glycine ligase
MKVLVIGSGGREHALVWKLSSSKRVSKIFCAPGNPGTANLATNLPIAVDAIPELIKFATGEKIDLTIVGPEYPLSLGIVDAFEKAHLRIFGPTKAASALEWSKSFAKEIMQAAGVATGRAQHCHSKAEASRLLARSTFPAVIKADGLAAGKGVVIVTNASEGQTALNFVFDELKSETVLFEEFLEGVEASYIVATDGERIVPFAAAHDYKRLRDQQQGPNTGGMGTVSPSDHLSAEQENAVLERVIKPVVTEMRKRGTPFRGFLYAGLMISPQGVINVIEFNARMGDPECQSILVRMEADLFELLLALTEGTPLPEVRWKNETAVTVVLAAPGYPEKVQKGDEIFGIDHAATLPGVTILHAGTAFKADDTRGAVITSGGRVLNVVAHATNLDEARKCAYRAADMIQFRGVQLRRDIGL